MKRNRGIIGTEEARTQRAASAARQETNQPRIAAVLGLALMVVTLAAFWPVRQFEFVDYDDPDYVTENRLVLAGLTWPGIQSAFVRTVSGNWQPVTVLSHLLDGQLYGTNPAGHHLTNLLLHLANTGLLFGVSRRMTGSVWRSLFVAGFFALHPLRVESVAWVAERKDVLSGLFFFLTLWAYARHAQGQRGKGAERNMIQRSAPLPFSFSPFPTFYWLALLFFALGLMSKPMLVTLPFVLLLLDYWPLRRWSLSGRTAGISNGGRLVLEKTPFLLLSAVASAIAFWAQQQGGALATPEGFPLASRLGNALISYFRYLGKMLWPDELAVFYPHPGIWSLWPVLGAGLLLLGVTWLALNWRRRRPYLWVGWCWYVGMLVPVIGLVQVGMQSMADRYTYLPQIGVFIALVWLAAEGARGRGLAWTLTGLAVCGLLACFVATRRQLEHWRNTEALFRRALRVTSNNDVAHNGLGLVLYHQGKLDEAVAQFQAAIRLRPGHAVAHNNLGGALLDQGKFAEAIPHLQEALRLNPGMAAAWNNLGRASFDQGRVEEAVTHYRSALRLNPDSVDARYHLGLALLQRDEAAEAAAHFEAALQLNPNHANAHWHLGNIRHNQGRFAEATAHFQAAVRLKPGLALAHHNLGASLAAQGRVEEAAAEFAAALKLKPDYASAQYQLARLWLLQGRTADAAKMFAAAARNQPGFAESHYHLGVLLSRERNVREALPHLREAARLKPDWVAALNSLAWILATHPDAQFRDGAEAVRAAERAGELTRRADAQVLDTLAAAYAEAGRFAEAASTVQAAADLAATANDQKLVEEFQTRLRLYQSRQPFRQ